VQDPNCQDPIKVVDLKKTYPNGLPAVKDVSFGVEKGQIFGLLGPNGAGKSTTFNIVTAMIPRTAGSVKLMETEIDRNLFEVYQNVGCCPQFDCYWDVLTVKQHLQLFGRMKGLTGNDLEESVDYYIKILLLEDHANKRASILSGGTKRKLCVANALIGGPRIQFLDEPSTGLDAIAKKHLWHAMSQNLVTRNASIILTTHSISEAESMCHKIGILINGKFVCLGPTQYLKSRYGQGYKLTIKKYAQNLDFAQTIASIFPNCVRLPDAATNSETYQISNQNFSFAKAFGALLKMQKDNVIADFSIYNTTLEQVFIQFARYQIPGAN